MDLRIVGDDQAIAGRSRCRRASADRMRVARPRRGRCRQRGANSMAASRPHVVRVSGFLREALDRG